MKHLFLLWQEESKRPEPGSAEMEAELAAYGAVYQQASAAGVFQGGDPLQTTSAAQTVRVRDGAPQATPGTFSSGAEAVIGYYVIDCKDADEAAAWAAKIPAAARGAVEVRPILEM